MDGYDYKAKTRQADRYRRKQEENRQERIARITRLQKEELAKDSEVLSQIAGLGQPYKGPMWFHSDYVDRSRGYVLEVIGRMFTNNLNENIIGEINNRVYDTGWLNEKSYGHLGDMPTLGPYPISDRRSHPMNTLKRLAETSHYSPASSPKANDRSWDQILSAINLVHFLRLLRRFSDRRYPMTSKYPLPDGSNLESNVLKVSWVLHRAWIRVLHLRSLKVGYEDYGLDQLKQILKLGLAFHQGEMEEAPFFPEEFQQLPPNFGILRGFYTSMLKALNEVASELFVESRSVDPASPISIEETLLYNLDPQRFAAITGKHFVSLGYHWTLFVSLLTKAHDLETRLDVEHVEDVLINKRVVVDDERWEIYNELRDENYDPIHPFDIPMFANGGRQSTIEPFLKKISQVNRRRRNYLLLRDWSKRRPWKQLYMVYNTADGEEEYLREPIADFYAKIDELKQVERANGYEDDRNPSLPANIWSCLFPIHPIASHGPLVSKGDDKRPAAGVEPAPLFRPRFFGESCLICMESYDERIGGVLAELHCGHLFHFICIREAWDTHGVYRSICPYCRSKGAEWYLHEQAGIYPEAIDVWDNRTVGRVNAAAARAHPPTPAAWAQMTDHQRTMEGRAQNPDLVQEAYDKYDNEEYLASRDWDRHPLGGDGAARFAKIELTHLRRRRRAQNAERRQKVKDAGTGISA